MWNLWFIITFLTLPEMINLSSWLLSPSWTPLLFTSSPLARISWASGGMPVTSRLTRTAWNRGEQRSKIIDLGKWWPYIMALIIMAIMVSENHWIIHSPEMLGPFWDDSPYKNHDSRARENSEVVIIHPDIYIYTYSYGFGYGPKLQILYGIIGFDAAGPWLL